MELTPDDRFMERAEERRAELDALDDDELKERFLEKLEARVDAAEERLSMLKTFRFGSKRNDPNCNPSQEQVVEAAEEMFARQELVEQRREEDLDREDLMLALHESRGPLADDLTK